MKPACANAGFRRRSEDAPPSAARGVGEGRRAPIRPRLLRHRRERRAGAHRGSCPTRPPRRARQREWSATMTRSARDRRRRCDERRRCGRSAIMRQRHAEREPGDASRPPTAWIRRVDLRLAVARARRQRPSGRSFEIDAGVSGRRDQTYARPSRAEDAERASPESRPGTAKVPREDGERRLEKLARDRLESMSGRAAEGAEHAACGGEESAATDAASAGYQRITAAREEI